MSESLMHPLHDYVARQLLERPKHGVVADSSLVQTAAYSLEAIQ